MKSGTVFTQAYFTIYCVIKAFIIDLHVKKNSQHIQGGPPPPPERNPDNIDISNIAVFAWDLYILGWMEHCWNGGSNNWSVCFSPWSVTFSLASLSSVISAASLSLIHCKIWCLSVAVSTANLSHWRAFTCCNLALLSAVVSATKHSH